MRDASRARTVAPHRGDSSHLHRGAALLRDAPSEFFSPSPPASQADQRHAAEIFDPSARHRVERLTLNLPVGLIEELRNAVYWTPGSTLTGLVRDALRDCLARLEAVNGRRYPERLGQLRAGRPRKRPGPSPQQEPFLRAHPGWAPHPNIGMLASLSDDSAMNIQSQ